MKILIRYNENNVLPNYEHPFIKKLYKKQKPMFDFAYFNWLKLTSNIWEYRYFKYVLNKYYSKKEIICFLKEYPEFLIL